MPREFEKRLDIRNPEELRQAKPEGMFIYYQPDAKQNARVKEILTATFPRHLVFVQQGVFSEFGWPADSGTQIGSTLYSNRAAVLYALEGLRQMTNFPMGSRGGKPCYSQDMYAVIPPDVRPHLEGGYTVPVSRSCVLAYSGRLDPLDYPQMFFDNTEVQMVQMTNIEIGLRKLTQGLSFDDESKKLVHSFKNDWVYGQKDGIHHIDCVLTGFTTSMRPHSSIHWYLDEALRTYIPHAVFHQDETFPVMKPFPHELTLRGGLNIQYTWNGLEWIALVPSLSTIGPLAQELPVAEYRIVELGDDQVRMNGGVKCRSLAIRWRT